MSKKFEGEFFSPSKKKRSIIPLIGKGFCEVSLEGLRVKARRKTSQKPKLFFLLVSGAALGMFLSLQLHFNPLLILAGVLMVTLPISLWMLNSNIGDDIDLVIPWQYVVKTERMSEANSTFQTVFVTVLGFKLNGELCFLPVSGGKEMIQEMNAARKSFFLKQGKKMKELSNRTILIER